MRWFRNLRLARKLALSFAVLLGVTAGVGLFALRGTARVNAAAADLGGHWLPSVRFSLAVSKAAADYRGAEAMLVVARASADRDGYQAEMDAHQESIAQAAQKLAAALRTKDDSATYAEFRAAWDAYGETSKRVVAFGRGDQADSALALLSGDSQEQYDRASGALARLADAAEEGSREQVAAGARTFAVTQRTVVAALAAGVLAGVLVAVALVRGVARPVREIAERMRRLAEGDVEQHVEVTTRDEVGELAESFRTIVAAQAGVAAAARRMAEGDVSVPVEPRSDRDELARSFAEVQATLRALVGEAAGLAAAARAGRLAERGDADRFRGAYRELVVGMNDMIAALGAPAAEVAEVMGRVAGRDLTARMTRDYEGDLVALKHSVNTAVETLDASLAQVAASGTQVAAASAEIAGGSTALAQGASQQAGALQEVSASLHQLAAAAKQNAANARQARAMADNARGGAAAGVASMQRLSEAVERIKHSADRTASVVRTIDELAFQTNLLALNAAVEAARAGDAGRGFAVVAEEVRALAQRSAAAARETGALIQESVRAADEGVSLNGEVLGRLRQINADVDTVGGVMAEIAASSEQQDLGVGQINGGLESMNGVTQQVATSAQESSSAAVELSSQAESMRDLVGTFRLTPDGAPAAAAPRAAGPARPVRPAAPARRVPASKPAVPTPAAPMRAAPTPAAPSRVPLEAWEGSPESLLPFDDDEDVLRDF
jgi:methyl-accepting chemotaxis protein